MSARADISFLGGINVMKDNILYYSVGALLYCPANNESIVDSITKEKFGTKFSLNKKKKKKINNNPLAKPEQTLVNSIT